jgi:hypothetical protein
MKFEDSSIASADYDPESYILTIRFSRSGDRYRYFDVDADIYEDLCDAPVTGKFFARYILGHHHAEKIT